MGPSAQTLRSLLGEFANDVDPDFDRYTAALRRTLTQFGSETPDNMAAIGRIAVGAVADELAGQTAGLVLGESGLALTEVLNVLEDVALPDEVRATLPELTAEDYAAALRIAVLCLSAFENTARGRADG